MMGGIIMMNYNKTVAVITESNRVEMTDVMEMCYIKQINHRG
jgi:hypothetical protein